MRKKGFYWVNLAHEDPRLEINVGLTVVAFYEPGAGSRWSAKEGKRVPSGIWLFGGSVIEEDDDIDQRLTVLSERLEPPA